MTEDIIEARRPADEERQLRALFLEMEKNQLEFLDQAAKRFIELTTGLVGVVFAVTAFGEDFPPPYLKDRPLVQALATLVLILYLGALLCALLAVQPRSYRLYRENLTEMRRQLDTIISYKSRWLRRASVQFYLATLMLAFLIGAIIWQ